MFKRYYLIIKKYFSFGANSKKYLFHLFFSTFLSNITLLTLPFVASLIVDTITNKTYRLSYIYILVFLICSLGYVLCRHYHYVAYKNNSVYVHNKLQQMILEKVTTFDEDFTKNMKTSFIVNTAFADVGKVMQVPTELSNCLSYIISILISLVILSSVNIYMGIITVILFVFSFFSVSHNLKKRDYYLKYQRKYQDDISEIMGQALDGNTEIKAFNMKQDLNEYLEKSKTLWRKHYFQKRKYHDYFEVLSPIILEGGKIIIYFIAIYLILHGKYNISTLILVIGYYEEVITKFEKLCARLDELSSNSTRVDRIGRILKYNNRNIMSFGENENDFIDGKITFKKVSFTYEKQQILKNVSFEIKPNSFIAIVGKSGSGKSTIFRLLLRLYKADHGDILLDNESIYDYTKEVYSTNVSIVTQKPFIFDMSIRENLNLVDSNHEHQIEACKRAGIHDYIMGLKDGYNTKLVSDASNISSGQKQLIALARTLLSKSEVLLFDEVTSTLDVNTSKKVMEILKDLKRDHTILMITHKPSLMKLADSILVIDKGKLVARGSHSALMKSSKEYQLLQK